MVPGIASTLGTVVLPRAAAVYDPLPTNSHPFEITLTNLPFPLAKSHN